MKMPAFCSGKEIVVMGDFNLPSIQWANDTPCRDLPLIELQFYYCFMALGLTQWVKESTFVPSGNILDFGGRQSW